MKYHLHFQFHKCVHVTTQSVQQPRECFQTVVILLENVVWFSYWPKGHQRNSLCYSVVHCSRLPKPCNHAKLGTTQSLLSINCYPNRKCGWIQLWAVGPLSEQRAPTHSALRLGPRNSVRHSVVRCS